MAGLAVRSVAVTGANRGLGLELVKQFLRLPCPPQTVLATCRNPAGPGAQELRTLASKHPNLAILKLEVTDEKSVQEAVKSAEAHLAGEGLNFLINNAGVMRPCTLESAAPEGMLEVYNINLVGPMLVTKAFLPFLKRAAQGSQHEGLSCSRAAIINMSALLGSIEKTPELYFFLPVVSYRCSKAALNMLTKCQSVAYKEEGILCTAIHPGWVRTDMGGEQRWFLNAALHFQDSLGRHVLEQASGAFPTRRLLLAPLTVEQSVSALMNLLASLSEKQHGVLVTWEGETVPW